MTSSQPRPTVTVRSRSLWRIRLGRELPRYVLCATSAAGLLASARFAIAPPRAHAPAPRVAEVNRSDRAGESFATLFARRYLTWNAAEPQTSADALQPFEGPGLEADAGLELPARGQQRVEWAEVAQADERRAGVTDYTVEAQTDDFGLLYLTVPVGRTADGSLVLAGYPAFVGAPVAGPAALQGGLAEVNEAALATVVRRVLRNYLAASASELEADLAGGARVALPQQPLVLESVERLDWAVADSVVVATVEAQDSRGVQYTLAYELSVVRAQGRWEIAAVQTHPVTQLTTRGAP